MSDPPADDATIARRLVAAARFATLATVAHAGTDVAGYPFASLVAIAADADGRPLLLLSALAEHTHNLRARAEASILVAEEGTADALARGRVTLVGPCAPVPDDEQATARDVYLAAHPRAAGYLALRDFAFWRLAPVSVRWIGGFGRMSWLDATTYLSARP